MKSITLGEQRNSFAYYIGMYIIVINEIDTRLIINHRNIFGNGELASKSYMKKTMAGRIKSVLNFVKDKDPNRQHLGRILEEVQSILWIRNALAHGFICGGGEAPSYLTLMAFGHEENFSPESLKVQVQKTIDLSRSTGEALLNIIFYDMAIERDKKTDD
ncbi:hypothetical protein [Pectobacterium aroidearum]|uniref:hypothetical protein n=1 Tax=Pectobacterium aroidearum TaxID=1201031 RepID=UPI003019B276